MKDENKVADEDNIVKGMVVKPEDMNIKVKTDQQLFEESSNVI